MTPISFMIVCSLRQIFTVTSHMTQSARWIVEYPEVLALEQKPYAAGQALLMQSGANNKLLQLRIHVPCIGKAYKGASARSRSNNLNYFTCFN